MPRRAVNEDDGYIDRTDEIYVNAFFVDGDNGNRLAKSNVVSRQF